MTAVSQAQIAAGRSQPVAVPAVERHRWLAVRRFASVLGLFALATLVILWPWFAHLHSALIGPPEDNMQDFWNSWYAVVGRDPEHFFATNLLRFPQGTPLVYQSFAYPQVFAVVGLSRIFGTDRATLVALQNITLLASFPISGLGAFYLVRHFVRSTAGGLAGGFVFAFNPSHVAQTMHHAHVSSIEFIPFFVLAYQLALERKSIAWLGAAVIFYALSALSCWYYLFYCAYFVGFQLLYLRMRDRRWPRGWEPQAAAILFLSTAAILSPLLLPMMLSAGKSVYDPGSNTFVADLVAYVAFPPEHAFSALSRNVYDRLTGNPWEDTVYLGLINLAVLTWFCLRTGFARDSLAFYVLFGMILFAVIASGEALHVNGAVTFLHLPDVALDKLPFFANVRTPSRAIVFVYLFLAIGIGAAVVIAFRHRSLAWRAGATMIAALIVMDFYPAHLSATPVACPAGLAVLDRDRERDFGVLNLPFGYAEGNAYMLEQTCHGRPLVDGNTTREMADTLIYHLSLNDPSKLRRQLAHNHVEYILLHHPKDGLFAWGRAMPPVARLRDAFRVAYDGADLIVLRAY